MSVLAEFSMFPTDRGESLSPYVARAIEIVEASGLRYKLGPMGTTIEADSAREIFEVVEQCLAALQSDCHRVEAVIKLDWRASAGETIDRKVASVEAKIGHKLCT